MPQGAAAAGAGTTAHSQRSSTVRALSPVRIASREDRSMRSTLAPLIAFLVIALHACGGDTPGRDAAAAIPDSAPANAETGADIVTDSASTPAAGGSEAESVTMSAPDSAST